MNGLKKLLLLLLGEKRYLSLLAASFQRLYKTVGLGIDYQDIYFLKQLIGEGNYCVDIGAHLGYFTLEMSRLVKGAGKVYAIEPMSKFYNTLRQQLDSRNIRNVTLYQFAMGGDSEFVEMGIPSVNKVKKFAYARIMKSNQTLDYIESERVKNESGDNLFLSLPRLDLVKCDVEGLELPVVEGMLKTIERFKPILLCELADKNERIRLSDLLNPLGYETYLLDNKRLVLLDTHSDKKAVSHNHYYIPALHADRLKGLIDR
jgi:FkbM family methyltransferase